MVSFPHSDTHDEDYFTLPGHEIEAAEFIAEVGRHFQEAFLQRKHETKLTQQQLAQLLEVNRSHIHRCLSGHSNMTLETAAQLAWALKAKPRFWLDLEPCPVEERANFFAHPPTSASVPAGSKAIFLNEGTGQLGIHVYPSATTVMNNTLDSLSNLECTR